MKEKKPLRYLLFLLFTLILSIPFYLLGVFFPVENLPFGLPISFLMIFVPFFLSLFYGYNQFGVDGIKNLFASVFAIKNFKVWSILFSLFCMPIIVLLTYFTMKIGALPLPPTIIIPYSEILFMFLLYFLGAIPEEFGWTSILTGPLVKTYGPTKSGVLIGSVWGIWHIIPWSWEHSFSWIVGMLILNIFMRIAMVYNYIYGGRKLLSALVFHTMINVSIGLFPNYGSHLNTLILSFWMFILLAVLVLFVKTNQRKHLINNDELYQ